MVSTRPSPFSPECPARQDTSGGKSFRSMRLAKVSQIIQKQAFRPEKLQEIRKTGLAGNKKKRKWPLSETCSPERPAPASRNAALVRPRAGSPAFCGTEAAPVSVRLRTAPHRRRKPPKWRLPSSTSYESARRSFHRCRNRKGVAALSGQPRTDARGNAGLLSLRSQETRTYTLSNASPSSSPSGVSLSPDMVTLMLWVSPLSNLMVRMPSV